jgi:hypothetical protein
MATVVHVKPREPFAGFGNAFMQWGQGVAQRRHEDKMQQQAQENALMQYQARLNMNAQAKANEERGILTLLSQAEADDPSLGAGIQKADLSPGELLIFEQRQTEIEQERRDALTKLNLKNFYKPEQIPGYKPAPGEEKKLVNLETAKKQSEIVLNRERARSLALQWDAKFAAQGSNKGMIEAVKVGLRNNVKFRQQFTDAEGNVDNVALEAVAEELVTQKQYAGMVKYILTDGALPLYINPKTFEPTAMSSSEGFKQGTIEAHPKSGMVPLTQYAPLQKLIKQVKKPEFIARKHERLKDFVTGFVKDETIVNTLVSDEVLSRILAPYAEGLKGDELRNDSASILNSAIGNQIDIDRISAVDKKLFEKFYADTMLRIAEGIIKTAGSGTITSEELQKLPNFTQAKSATTLEIAKAFVKLGPSAVDPDTYSTNAKKLFADLEKDHIFLNRVLDTLGASESLKNTVQKIIIEPDPVNVGLPTMPKSDSSILGWLGNIVGSSKAGRQKVNGPGIILNKLIATGVATPSQLQAFYFGELIAFDPAANKRISDAITNIEATYENQGQLQYLDEMKILRNEPSRLQQYGIAPLPPQPGVQ